MLPNTEDEEAYVMISPKRDYVIQSINVTNSECPLKNVTVAEIAGVKDGNASKLLGIAWNSSMTVVSFPNISTYSVTYNFRIKIEANGSSSSSGALVYT